MLIRFCATAISCVALCACASRAQWQEVARVASPDHVLDAVLTQSSTDGGASFVYHVHVIKKGTAVAGQAAASLDGAMRNTTSFGVDLQWATSRRLEVRYLKADPVQVDQSVVTGVSPDLSVLLMAGVYDPDATSGGMRSQLNTPTSGSLPP